MQRKSKKLATQKSCNAKKLQRKSKKLATQKSCNANRKSWQRKLKKSCKVATQIKKKL